MYELNKGPVCLNHQVAIGVQQFGGPPPSLGTVAGRRASYVTVLLHLFVLTLEKSYGNVLELTQGVVAEFYGLFARLPS